MYSSNQKLNALSHMPRPSKSGTTSCCPGSGCIFVIELYYIGNHGPPSTFYSRHHTSIFLTFRNRVKHRQRLCPSPTSDLNLNDSGKKNGSSWNSCSWDTTLADCSFSQSSVCVLCRSLLQRLVAPLACPVYEIWRGRCPRARLSRILKHFRYQPKLVIWPDPEGQLLLFQ